GGGVAARLGGAGVLLENQQRRLGGSGIDHGAEADAHVEDLVHLAVLDLGMALDQGKYRMRLDRAVDHEADGGGGPRQVEKAVAGDVDERVDALDCLENLQRLGN